MLHVPSHFYAGQSYCVSNMDFKTIIVGESKADVTQFRKAVEIWRRNPHVANRRLLASVAILEMEINASIWDILCRIDSLNISRSDAEHDIDEKEILLLLKVDTFDRCANTVSLYVTKQLPRVPQIFSSGLEFSLLDVETNRVINIHKPFSAEKRSLGPTEAYTMQHEANGYTSMSIFFRETESNASIEWLKKGLFPCILKWMNNEPPRTSVISQSSLSLVSAEKYAKLYCELKGKYGTKLIENWPENTDPLKFVYEDIAIATYLLLLWEKERAEKDIENFQSFLDLGCGNGLLVYILFSEGHQGIGIDLRKRKIWDTYPAGTPLRIDTIVPSSSTVYPGIDWIIGNHSDELTPWIPVIAARSSANCRFFLLPCCSYELDGSKYQRYDATKSQYSEYIEYLQNLCEKCGFQTFVDKLRIPSTKRICLIGWGRMSEQDEARELRIQRVISAKTELEQRNAAGWSCNFKPREIVEKVRNCTQLEKTLITSIVNMVASQLLRDGRAIFLKDPPGKLWNAGRRLALRKVAESIPKVTLTRLRNECGGLQTLLRNHSHVFCVLQGEVEFRVPGREEADARSKKTKPPPRTKTKPCWFYTNHPHGCPATETNCNYKH